MTASQVNTGVTQESSAIISVRRISQFTALFTRFDVFIDDQKAGTLGNNEQEQYVVRPGLHTFQIKIDNFTSKKITIPLTPGETVRLVCGPKALGWGVNVGVE